MSDITAIRCSSFPLKEADATCSPSACLRQSAVPASSLFLSCYASGFSLSRSMCIWVGHLFTCFAIELEQVTSHLTWSTYLLVARRFPEVGTIDGMIKQAAFLSSTGVVKEGMWLTPLHVRQLRREYRASRQCRWGEVDLRCLENTFRTLPGNASQRMGQRTSEPWCSNLLGV